MKTIKAIIVDDEAGCIDMLSLLLNYHPDIEIIDTAVSVETALPLIKKHGSELDLLFLDVQMPGGDGFTLLQKIPEIKFGIIFTTAYDDYAIKAIKFSALDYLLKPIDHEDLTAALNKLRKMQTEEEMARLEMLKQHLNLKGSYERIAVTGYNDIMVIEIDKILYLKSDNNYTTFYVEDDQQILSSKNIGYYEDILSSSNFFRVHNSYLINLKKIKRYIKGGAGSAEMENGEKIQVSVRRREEFIKILSLI
jgi:two-component system LytT family response regulator